MAKPKLLLDENIGYKVLLLLRKTGYDTTGIIEDSSGVKNITVLKVALKQKRVLVTLDRDFGKLVFSKSKKHFGILFLRLEKESPELIFSVIQRVISQYGSKLHNQFTTATEYSVRIR